MTITDTASLQIRVTSGGVDTASRGLLSLTRASAGAEQATESLSDSFRKFLGPLAAVGTAYKTLSKLTSVQREFDVLNAGLVTATGSAENAAIAFEALEEFAARTPYGLKQATEGFTKLVNLGLTPSERALESYGNTAAAMGKDLDQMVEAVADATTGEFERLKEFGIKTKNEGDRISFTFRGVTTTIGNNAAEIERYLMALGENEFAGAMEQRAKSLDGAISELGDSWDGLFRAVNDAGVGDIIESSVRKGIKAVEDMTAAVESGQVKAILDSQVIQWQAWGDDISATVKFVTEYLDTNYDGWREASVKTVDDIIDAFRKLPTNIKTSVSLMATYAASGFDTMLVDLRDVKEKIAGIFSGEDVGPIGARSQKAIKEIEAIKKARENHIDTIIDEHDKSSKAVDDMLKKAKELRQEYEKEREARKKANEGNDRLAGFFSGSRDPAGFGTDKAAAAEMKKQQDEFQRLVDFLRTEEEVIEDSYHERKAIIEKNTASGSGMRDDLMRRLESQYNEELSAFQEAQGRELETLRVSLLTQEESIRESFERRLKIIQDNTTDGSAGQTDMISRLQAEYDGQLASLEAAKQRERDSLYNSLLSEEEAITQSYERRKTAILESTAITETERLELMKRLEQQYSDELAAMEQQRMENLLTNSATLFDGMAGLAKSYAGEQSGAYRTLFAISKAFSITQSAMSIATGLAKAQELGWPANLAAMASVAASGAAIMSQITGSNFSGAYDAGGTIPAGKIGLVGEYGPELVAGQAHVTSRKETAQILNGAAGGGEQAPPKVENKFKFVNALDTGSILGAIDTDEGETLVMNIMRRNPEFMKQMSSG